MLISASDPGVSPVDSVVNIRREDMSKHLFQTAWLSVLVLIIAGCQAKEAKPDIVDTAISAGDFGTLVKALDAAGLVEPLKGEGPFTVFAPTDEAFAKLPVGTLEDLLRPDKKADLQNILKYHVVPGKVMAQEVTKLDSAKTLQGKELAIMMHDGTVMVEDAKVVKTDIECSNGVIHVIDKVLLP
jgi:uncharacterized surface protein with fasciclin (FAS1) repeats